MEDTQKMPPGHYTDLPILPQAAALVFSLFRRTQLSSQEHGTCEGFWGPWRRTVADCIFQRWLQEPLLSQCSSKPGTPPPLEPEAWWLPVQ